jgi:hypothetical protein
MTKPKSKNPWAATKAKKKPQPPIKDATKVTISHCTFDAAPRHTPETVAAVTKLAEALSANSYAVTSIAEAR